MSMIAFVETPGVEENAYQVPLPSDSSGTETDIGSPHESDTDSERKMRQTPADSREARLKAQEAKGLIGTTVYAQFIQQRATEKKRLCRKWWRGEMGEGPLDDVAKRAGEIVDSRWIKQRIWNFKWSSLSHASWKHEEPLDYEVVSEPELGSDPESPGYIERRIENTAKQIAANYALHGIQQRTRRARPGGHLVQRLQTAANRSRSISEGEREASRPHLQFKYQLEQEQDRLHRQLKDVISGIQNTSHEMAHERVKKLWRKRGIWDERWGRYPGLSWKHEPWQEEDANGPQTWPAIYHRPPKWSLTARNVSKVEPLDFIVEPQLPKGSTNCALTDQPPPAQDTPDSCWDNDKDVEPSNAEHSLNSPPLGTGKQAARCISKKRRVRKGRAGSPGSIQTNISTTSKKGKSRLRRRPASTRGSIPLDESPSSKEHTGTRQGRQEAAGPQVSPASSSSRRSERLRKKEEAAHALASSEPPKSTAAGPAGQVEKQNHLTSKQDKASNRITASSTESRGLSMGKRKRGGGDREEDNKHARLEY